MSRKTSRRFGMRIKGPGRTRSMRRRTTRRLHDLTFRVLPASWGAPLPSAIEDVMKRALSYKDDEDRRRSMMYDLERLGNSREWINKFLRESKGKELEEFIKSFKYRAEYGHDDIGKRKSSTKPRPVEPTYVVPQKYTRSRGKRRYKTPESLRRFMQSHKKSRRKGNKIRYIFLT